MKLRRRTFLQFAGAAVAAPSHMAAAQTYPSRPITMVAPFPAGGPVDVVGRIVAERMGASLRQPVIIENVAGANGSIGAGRVARATPDGYTLVVSSWNTHVGNGALYPLPYDVLKDFEPVSLLALGRYLIVANRAVPANDLKGLIAWLKANRDKATAGTFGAGSAQHIGGILFQNITGARFRFVPYRGDAAASQDLLAGQIDMYFVGPATSLAHIRAGSIKAYAVTAERRLPAAPDIPTVDEAGLPGFYLSTWFAIWAPKNTPRSVIDKLNGAVVDASTEPSVRSRLTDLSFEVPPREQQTPEALGAFHKAEIEKWWPIIKAANIKGE
jgi:tripartite-type tricarboxylate transporter receptor subunit TctC